MKAQLDILKSIIDLPDDIKITFQNQRCKLPTAYFYLNRKPPEIVIVGNKPSLERYAIAELLAHELAEKEYYELCLPEVQDTHDTMIFQNIEREHKKKIDNAIFSEHE